MSVEYIIQILGFFLALLIVLPLHEFGHALVAVKCGDNTPKMLGRLSLNPMKHFDILGLVCFLFARFGWAKPVPINPNNFKSYKRDTVLVSLAGVFFNLVLAFISYPIIVLYLRTGFEFGYFDDLIYYFLYGLFILSINFSVFNLLPLFPLDGFRVLEALVDNANAVYRFLRNYSQYILLGLVVLSIIADYFPSLYYIDILSMTLGRLSYYVSVPISAFWGLIL